MGKLLVLNAFRHHGIGHVPCGTRRDKDGKCSTPSGIMESVTHCLTPFKGNYTSAQRLPASWNRSRKARAFRLLFAVVLNAFRHHGIGHLRIYAIRAQNATCSTPSGIMESVTGNIFLLANCRFVLNAFRHHGIGHSSGRTACRSRAWCSTPSGIMESVTL